MTESLSLDGEPLLAALEEAGIRFIVIGGFAVSAHGHLRATKDLVTKYGRLDVMQLIGPDFEYADLDAAAIEDEVFGHRVRFCGYRHLVAMKEAAGRDQDLEDLRKLREIREEGP